MAASRKRLLFGGAACSRQLQEAALLRSYRKLRSRYGDFYMYAHRSAHPDDSASPQPQRTSHNDTVTQPPPGEAQ